MPTKVAFFAWEASWGKVLTLDQLQRRGHSLANRCFLCLSKVEVDTFYFIVQRLGFYGIFFSPSLVWPRFSLVQ